MNLLEYTEKAHETCEPQCFNEEYLTLGLISEVGELAGKMKRVIRDGAEIDRKDTLSELGDILWYFSQLLKLREMSDGIDINLYNIDWARGGIYNSTVYLSCSANNFIDESSFHNTSGVISILKNLCMIFHSSLYEVAKLNIKKLQSRKDRGVICGEGDNR